MDSVHARALQRCCRFAAILAAVWTFAAGCVETAECDESARCPAGEVCYEFECRPRCEEDDECGNGATCRECVDPETDENHCFGERARACVE